MADSNENRAASSKTTRGSRNPNYCAGHDVIVQPNQPQVQRTITIEEVNRVLEVGKLLRAVLTPGEVEELQTLLEEGRSGHYADDYRQKHLVTVMALDAPLFLKDI